jgi:hypothetical protein
MVWLPGDYPPPPDDPTLRAILFAGTESLGDAEAAVSEKYTGDA